MAHNVGKRYRKRPVLRDVSLRVQRGESVGLLGPNGAGKTTLFYYRGHGLISADYGSISLDGRDITDLPMYRRARLGIGYLPQEPSIFRGLSVEKNIRAVLEAVDANRDRRGAAAGRPAGGIFDHPPAPHAGRLPCPVASGAGV